MHPIREHDVVALVVDLPDEHLYRGQVGTVVAELAPEVFEIEFSDRTNGVTYAMLPLRTNQLLLLYFGPIHGA